MEDNEPALDPAAAAHALLAWYRAAGVEDAVGEEAIDWYGQPERKPGAGFSLAAGSPPATATPAATRQPPPIDSRQGRPLPDMQPSERGGDAPPQPGSPRQFPATAPDAAVSTARAAASAVASLEDLRAALDGFTGCALKATAKNLCFFRGAPRARLMIIGEAPGRDEDLSGTPFVGPAGKLLDRMLTSAGIDPAEVHITNTVYWRPPGNRTPSPQETQACRPFLDRQIELVEPEIIALLGGAAANTMLGMAGGITKLRGTWREVEVGPRKLKTMASLHPAFLLRSPAYKRQAWRDMLAIADALGVPVVAARA